jgi:hypothetical protein
MLHVTPTPPAMADSKALRDLRTGLKAVDDVLGFVKTTAGKPSKQEKSLFVASVALSYAMWENYVEDVAVEATEALSTDVQKEDVPATVRDSIMKLQPTPTVWDIAVHPGWRSLWLAAVEQRAKGGANTDDLGMNTANQKNVRSLFERVGVDPFTQASDEDLENVEKLVKQRGQIVHTGKAPSDFYKEDAVGWRTFVEDLATKVDKAVGAQAKSLTGKTAW